MPETTVTIKDASGTSKTVRAWDDGTGKLAFIQHIVETVPTQEAGASVVKTKLTITTTAQSLNTLLAAANGAVKTGRTAVAIQNQGTGNIYVDDDNGVTNTSGAQPGWEVTDTVGARELDLPLGASDDVYLITDGAASITIVVLEV